MNLMEYVQKLIEEGTWARLSGDAHSIFIYILAKSQNKPVVVSFSELSKELSISVNTAKKHIKILLEEGLLIYDEKDSTYKPAVSLDNSHTNIPVPPTIPGVTPPADTDLFEWAKEFMNSPWGALIGGAVIGYLIRLWIEWIENQKKKSDPLASWPGFYQESPWEHLRLQETIEFLQKAEEKK